MTPPMALLLHPAARIALTEFTVHWSTVIGLVALGALYLWRAGQAEAGPSATPQDDECARLHASVRLAYRPRQRAAYRTLPLEA